MIPHSWVLLVALINPGGIDSATPLAAAFQTPLQAPLLSNPWERFYPDLKNYGPWTQTKWGYLGGPSDHPPGEPF